MWLSLSEIENQFENADRITIYRTLKTFEEKGIVHSIQENNTTKISALRGRLQRKYTQRQASAFLLQNL
jgi:Fe2+ or Zn2+ uptake regulation protein